MFINIVSCKARRQPKVIHYARMDFDNITIRPQLLCGQKLGVTVKTSASTLPYCKRCLARKNKIVERELNQWKPNKP